MYYYLSQIIDNPWLSDKIKVMASGDDVAVLGEPLIIDQLSIVIRRLTARNKDETSAIGLGQVVKEIKVSRWDDFDF